MASRKRFLRNKNIADINIKSTEQITTNQKKKNIINKIASSDKNKKKGNKKFTKKQKQMLKYYPFGSEELESCNVEVDAETDVSKDPQIEFEFDKKNIINMHYGD